MVLLANKLEVRKKRFSWEKPEEIQTDLQCVNVTSTETYEYCILCFFWSLRFIILRLSCLRFAEKYMK